MAILDPRLLPFIEMLAELGMDWLAFELVDGIRRGDVPADDEHALALARRQIGQLPADEFERHASANSVTTPFLGDDQLQWAVEYVFERLSATLAEMYKSLDALDEILDDPEERQPEASRVEPLLVLLDDGEEHVVRRAQVETAQAGLPELREALDVWLRSAPPEPAQ